MIETEHAETSSFLVVYLGSLGNDFFAHGLHIHLCTRRFLTVNTNRVNVSVSYRKHSSGDLHSRLKTRKLLGVGETDDGDVHRSKVKVQGHDQFTIRLLLMITEEFYTMK